VDGGWMMVVGWCLLIKSGGGNHSGVALRRKINNLKLWLLSFFFFLVLGFLLV